MTSIKSINRYSAVSGTAVSGIPALKGDTGTNRRFGRRAVSASPVDASPGRRGLEAPSPFRGELATPTHVPNPIWFESCRGVTSFEWPTNRPEGELTRFVTTVDVRAYAPRSVRDVAMAVADAASVTEVNLARRRAQDNAARSHASKDRSERARGGPRTAGSSSADGGPFSVGAGREGQPGEPR